MEAEVTAGELEHRAESTLVQILPNFDMDQLELISVKLTQGTFGPFEANIPVAVPLWLAVFLKKRHKCRVIPPEWMDLGALRLQLEEERTIDTLTVVPFHYLEISSLLLAVAKDDIRQRQLVMNTMEDLFTLRVTKLRQRLKSILPDTRVLDLTNVAAMELQTFRRMLDDLFAGFVLLRGP